MSDSELTIEHAEIVIRAIVKHMRDGGSYRYLIYDRLGFGPEAYAPLMCAGGMDLSNMCPVEQDEDWLPFISSIQTCRTVGYSKMGAEVRVMYREYNGEERIRTVNNPQYVEITPGCNVLVAYICRPDRGTLQIIPESGWSQREA